MIPAHSAADSRHPMHALTKFENDVFDEIKIENLLFCILYSPVLCVFFSLILILVLPNGFKAKPKKITQNISHIHCSRVWCQWHERGHIINFLCRRHTHAALAAQRSTPKERMLIQMGCCAEEKDDGVVNPNNVRCEVTSEWPYM